MHFYFYFYFDLQNIGWHTDFFLFLCCASPDTKTISSHKILYPAVTEANGFDIRIYWTVLLLQNLGFQPFTFRLQLFVYVKPEDLYLVFRELFEQSFFYLSACDPPPSKRNLFPPAVEVLRSSSNFSNYPFANSFWYDLVFPCRFSVNSSAFHPLERKCLPCPTWTTSQTHAWRRQLTQPRKSLLTIEFKTVDSYSFQRLYLTCHLHVPNTKNNGTFTPIKKRLHNAINRADYWLR